MQEAANTGFEAFDLLGIGVLVCAPGDLTVRFANARAKALFGPDLPGRPLLSAIATLELKAVAEASGKGRPYALAGEIAPPSGRRIAFRLTISPRRLGPEELLVAEIEDAPSKGSRSICSTPSRAWSSARRARSRRSASAPRSC
jgi:PAS domain-containing protein